MFSRSLLGVACRHSTVQHLVHCSRLTVVQTPLHLPLACTLIPVRCLHLSAKRCEEEEQEGRGKARIKARKKAKLRKEAEKKNLNEEILSAAVEAAKTLPGDWTRTADDLMTRLQMHDGKDSVKATETADEKTEPLLAEMQVGREFERRKSQSDGQTLEESMARDLRDSVPRPRLIRSRTPEKLDKVFGQPPLGIFDPKTFAGSAVEEEKDLWHEKDLEDLRKARGSLPRNAFEEMIQWTKAGQMWTFPVDNEADMHEERKYKFHQHIFLERHLEDFPSQGPLRRFMDLVVLGLSQNPWVTVPEKEEHIRWFVHYFREKQNLLEPALGDQAKMKEVIGET